MTRADLIPAKGTFVGRVAAAPNKLGVYTDADAVDRWLSEHTAGTRREYARHSARLVAWLSSVQTTLNDCTYEHLRQYFDQLDDLALLTEHIARFVPLEWQSEFKALFAVGNNAPPKRAARSRKIIVALFRWLQLAGYLSTIAIPKVKAGEVDGDGDRTELQREQLAHRVLADHQWAIVDAAVEQLNWQRELQSRCRAIAVWLRESGARRQELAAARLDAMQRHAGEAGEPPVWLWRIRGKGKKVRYVAVTPAMIDAFKRYRLAQGIPFVEADPFLIPRVSDIDRERGIEPDTFLFYGVYRAATATDASALAVAQHRPRIAAHSISTTTVYNDIKMVASAAALLCSSDADRARVAALSPHWFRHRRALQLSKRLTLVQVAQYLGHASIETTKAYSFDDEVDLARVVLAAL